MNVESLDWSDGPTEEEWAALDAYWHAFGARDEFEDWIWDALPPGPEYYLWLRDAGCSAPSTTAKGSDVPARLDR